jgi:hypothetical protein
VGTPHDIGVVSRAEGVDSSVRVQGYYGPVIVGASHTNSEPYMRGSFVRGRSTFTGVDVRFMHDGIQVRGEWLSGHPFVGTGVRTDGWYVDALVHRLGMGPVTAVARIESMNYLARPPRARQADRFLTGARVRLPGPVTIQLNYVNQRGDLERAKDHSLDLGVTYSFRYN